METKVAGAPGYPGTPARGALDDWTNRRKELKFAATDLKLRRRVQRESIRHWGVWREQAEPKAYFLWAVRLRAASEGKPDSLQALTREAAALLDTYLDGVAIEAWTIGAAGKYENVPLPIGSRALSLDDVLYRIQSEIEARLDARGQPPDPVVPAPVVDVGGLIDGE